MEKHFPSFVLKWKRGIATWTGILQPTPASDRYTVKIQYSLSDVPNVWVISPQLLERPTGEKIPHVYGGNRLCLYLPGSGEWERTKLIAETIVPWASLWLYYYELWHATGEWLGGGIHPDVSTLRPKKLKKITGKSHQSGIV